MKDITNYLILILLFVSLVVSKNTDEVNNIFKTHFFLNSEINKIYSDIKEEIVEIDTVEDPCKPRNISDLEGKKLIAFTFDDGPNNATTLKLLDGLKKYDARATFFVLGSRIDNHKESLIKSYQQCNQIGNHTYNHLNLLKQNINTISDEINNTNDSIYNILGEYPTVIRSPYGNTDQDIKAIGNMSTILWDVDTLDWKYRNSLKVADEIVKNAHDGAIILLHDIYSTSVDGALIAMEELKDEYAFVTIEEMMILKNVNFDISKTYYNFK